jgi:hypothetical protein
MRESCGTIVGRCYLCGTDGAFILAHTENATIERIKCHYCGTYKISDQAIRIKAYENPTR